MNGLTPTRRTLVTGAAWSVPVVSIAAATPAFASSLRKDPGINGWVEVTTRPTTTDGTYNVEFDSTPAGAGPDGAPFGLFIYDVNRAPDDMFQNAKITLWINDAQASMVPSVLAGHSGSWGGPVGVGPAVKPDGFIYTGYRYSYTAAILASSYVVDPFDGVQRLYLGDFHVNLRVDQVANNAADNITYWVERSIDIQTQGSGPYVTSSFQRRNGARGPLGDGFPGSFAPQLRAASPGLPA